MWVFTRTIWAFSLKDLRLYNTQCKEAVSKITEHLMKFDVDGAPIFY
jgi:hypothetical protein